MAKGILYVMETVVPGLVKIGKTGLGNFEGRMYSLERNGYFNVVGLKRRFAVAVEDYDEKEAMLDEIFSRARVPGSELFALDIDLVIQLLSSFEGEQVYPQDESKETSFDQATEKRRMKEDMLGIPNGTYALKATHRAGITAGATMVVEDGAFIVKAGAVCLQAKPGMWQPAARAEAPIVDNVLQADVETGSPSTAARVVLGFSANGWTSWLTADGEPIDVYRQAQ